jgi:hypothetical protein
MNLKWGEDNNEYDDAIDRHDREKGRNGRGKPHKM